MDPQAAIDAPRWGSFPGTDPATLQHPMELRVEADRPDATVRAFQAMGHQVARRRPGVHDGKIQRIVRDPQRGMLMGAAEPRGDSQTVGVYYAWS